jgi:pimeloyl-ACP methyl ester carboxylesterase
MRDVPELSGIFDTSFGSGPRRVLAIHCTLAHSGAWRPLAKVLTNEVTIVAFDMPSHGRSEDWAPETGDYYDMGTAAASALLTEPMDIVGHSFGAVVALRLAAEQPEMVRSLTLIEPVFFAIVAEDAPDRVPAPDAPPEPFMRAYLDGDAETAARLFNRAWGDGPKWADLPEPARAAMVRGIHVVPACAAPIRDDSAGLLGKLDRIVAPVLLLRGSQSDPDIAVVNDGLARRLPNARSLVVEGAGHMLPITHPQETADMLRAHFVRA